jgi:hypothetical protein
MEEGSCTSLCLDLEPACTRLDKDDVVARRDLQRLPDSRGKGDPPSGLDGSNAVHVDPWTHSFLHGARVGISPSGSAPLRSERARGVSSANRAVLTPD